MQDNENKQLASILESVDAAIITTDDHGIVQSVNSATTRMFGFDSSAIIGNNVKMLMPEPARKEHDGYVRHYMQTGEKRIIGLGRKESGLRADGKEFPMHLSVAKYEDGGKTLFTGVIHDLTELDYAKSQSTRLSQIVDESINEIFTFEIDSLRITTANKRALTNLGYSQEELCMLTPTSIIKNLSEERLRKTIKPLVDKRQSRLHLTQIQVRKDNTEYDTDVYLHLSEAFDPPELVAIVQDVTENKRMLNAIRHKHKIESIGNLTGGIAHDFNNILTVVLGNLELLEEELVRDEDLELLKEAKDAANMGARLTKRLLTFARRSPLAPKNTNINKLICDLSDMLHRTFGGNIQLRTILSPTLWTANVDISEFENALVNLAINARDAMPEGGELVIETENSELDEDSLPGKVITPGGFVRVSISDTGSGIDEKIKDTLFEPFVTTKSEAHGTGLGLSMVHGFINQSHGHVFVYSEAGMGTTISLYLPAIVKRLTNANADPHDSELATIDSMLILVAEDDTLVMKLTVRRLQRMGHQVLQAGDGHTALELFKQFPDIDLVFSDVVMAGGMSGYDLAKAIRAIDPEKRILLTSGYAENIVNATKLAQVGLSLLRKPYQQQDLVDAIKAICSGK